MKKRKIALIAAFAAVSAFSLASCNNAGGSGTTPSTSGSQESGTGSASSSAQGPAQRLDVYYTYDGKAYIDAKEGFANPISGTQFAENTLLPVWKLYGEKKNIDIRNACKHDGSRATAKYDQLVTDQFKSETSTSDKIDLYGIAVSKIEDMVSNGNATSLTPYINSGKMPNLKRFLDDNPKIKASMEIDGEIYYTAYFDGHNKIERMLQMDTAVVDKLLATKLTSGLDSTPAVDAARIKSVNYSPFIDENFNLPKADSSATTTTVKISKNKTAVDLTVKYAENIIKQQNTLLASSSTTGADLYNQFMTYLEAVYGDNVGSNKTYANYAEIFTSESAAYTTDELIALYRVFRANPSFISNNKNTSVVPAIVREQADGRVDTMLNLMATIFGIQGIGSEYTRLFYAADGKLADATTEVASYQALSLMADLYKEGLILENFYKKTSTGLTKYAQHYFAKTTANGDDSGNYALMEYDYAATQSVWNQKDSNGIGVEASDSSASTKIAAGYDYAKLRPVLAPLTWWAKDSFTHGQELSNHTGKSLVRYYEENRALKSDAWCIPANADNKDDAVALMDYIYGDEGQIYNDFGPEAYHTTDKPLTYGDQNTVALTPAVIAWYVGQSLDFWTFNRKYIGTTDAIGYIRTSTIDYQATNLVSRVGVDNLNAAVTAGVQLGSYDNTATIGFGTTVPTVGWANIAKTASDSYDSVTEFWAATKNKADALGWAYVIVNDTPYNDSTAKLGKTTNTKVDYYYNNVVSEFTSRNVNFLGANAQALELKGITGVRPDYSRAA